MGPHLHLETVPVEGSVDKAQILGIRLGLRIMKLFGAIRYFYLRHIDGLGTGQHHTEVVHDAGVRSDLN